MECRLQGICRFIGLVPIENASSGLTERLDEFEEAVKKLAADILSHKTPVGGGSIKEKPGKGNRTERHCKKCDFVARAEYETDAKVLMMVHCKKHHPKAEAAGRKSKEKTPADLQPANDKKAEHAFKALQKRANKGKLTEEQTTVFDNIEPSVIGKRAKDWPDGAKESVINLHKDVTGKREDN